MLEWVIDFFTKFVGVYGYLIIFVLSLLENSIFLGAFIPGEVTAILAGFYASQKILNWPFVVILIFTGSVIGDNLGFYLGRTRGKRWLNKIGPVFGYQPEKIERAEEFWVDHGGKAVIFARFIAVARTFVPFLAGASKLKHVKFFYYDFMGSLVHALVMVALGYFFGEYWKTISNSVGIVGFILLLILLIFVYRYLVQKGLTILDENEDK